MEWRIIPEYPNYEASNTGEIRRRLNGVVIKQQLDDRDYLTVTLYTNKKKYKKRVARLIWSAFAGCECKHTVDHIDRNKVNNEVSNLRCITAKENSQNRDNYSNKTNKYNLTPEKKRALFNAYKNKEITSYKIHKLYGIPSNYFFEMLKRYDKKNSIANDTETIREV